MLFAQPSGRIRWDLRLAWKMLGDELETSLDTIDSMLSSLLPNSQRSRETTIFSIGGRGHYENAISDVLAFFLDQGREHGFGTAILHCLFSCAGLESENFVARSAPIREYTTVDGKRIDLLIEGEADVLVIENKVRHHAVNPFTAYEADIEQAYPGKRQIRLLLTFRDDCIDGWHTVRYQQFTRCIRERLGQWLVEFSYSKWIVLLREFVLNLEEEMGAESQIEGEAKFAAENFKALNEAIDLYWRFVNHVADLALESVAGQLKLSSMSLLSTAAHDWRNAGRAIRVYCPSVWGPGSNVVLLLRRDGGTSVQMYAYGIAEEARVDALALLKGPETPETWLEAGNTILAAGNRAGPSVSVEEGVRQMKAAAVRLSKASEFRRRA